MCDPAHGEGPGGSRDSYKRDQDPTLKITYHKVRDFAVDMEEKENYLVKMLGGDMSTGVLLRVARQENKQSREDP